MCHQHWLLPQGVIAVLEGGLPVVLFVVVGGGFAGFVSFVPPWGIYVFQMFDTGPSRQEA